MEGATMKRDMELIRRILLDIEESEVAPGVPMAMELPDVEPDLLNYHLGLMKDHGLIEAADSQTMTGRSYQPQGLTWEGHEFLDATRNDTVWKKVLAYVQDKGGGATFEIIQQLAVQFAKDQLLGPGR
jgi:hypothetical protein